MTRSPRSRVDMSDLWMLTASEIVEAVRTREVCVRDIVESVLHRIEEVDPVVNAVPEVLADEARATAEQLDRSVSNGYAPSGVLLGVPVTVKPNVDLEGFATHEGCPGLTGTPAIRDSYTIAGLKQAGAVIVGRTNMPEFAMRWQTDGPLHGQTVNPWDPGTVPGGSTGGGAAAVATGMGAMAHGNDLGGSLRQPAECCGVVAIRPTSGRTPARRRGAYHSPEAQLMSMDGPIARTVADAWLGLLAMTSATGSEPLAAPVLLRDVRRAPMRVGVVVDPDGDGVHPDVARSVRLAAEALANSGHTVEDCSPPPVGAAARDRNDLVWAKVPTMLESLQGIAGPDIQRVWRHMAQATQKSDITSYADLFAARAQHMLEWDDFMSRFDIVLGPVSTDPPFEVGMDQGGYSRFAEVLHSLRFVLGLVVTGLPVLVLPTGSSPNGTPLGVQVVGQRWREDQCVAAGGDIEESLGRITPIDPRPRAYPELSPR